MLGLGAITVLALAAGEPGEVAPGAKTMRLFYEREAGAEACSTEPQLRAAVEGRLGYDPVRSDAGGMLLARVGKSATGFTALIELVDEAGLSRGKRELSTEGANCEEMARAMALSISIAIDPERAALAEQALAPTEPVASEPSAPKLAVEAAPEKPVTAAPLRLAPPVTPAADQPTAPSPPPRSRFGLSVAGMAMAGVAPGVTYGGALALEYERGPWSFGGGVRLLRSAAAPVDPTTRLQVTLAAAEFSGCAHYSLLEGCAIGVAGASRVSSRGIPRPATDSGAFAALGLRLGVVAPVSAKLSLFGRLEAVGVVAPVHPQIDGLEVWAAPSLAGGLAAGARGDFW